MREYIAFIHKEEDSYVAVVPDLNYTSSFGDTFKDTVHNIIDACELYCEDLITLPKASSLEEALSSKKFDLEAGAMPQLINVKVEKLRRINIMMRSDIIEAMPERLAEYNGNRSAYLQALAIRDLNSHGADLHS